MTPPEKAFGRAETWSCLVILSCLACVAVGVFHQQYSFNPAVLALQTPVTARPVHSAAATAPPWLPAELQVSGEPESFTPDNLYNKIDGKAELYTAAGVVGMKCQRFALKASPDDWLEWSVYDMGSLPHAFSVFSTQRRAEGQPLDLTAYAYQTQNALYFVAGNNYIEAVASSANRPLLDALLALAKRFVAANSEGAGQMPEMQLLPAENLVAGSFDCKPPMRSGSTSLKTSSRLNIKSVTVRSWPSSPGARICQRRKSSAKLIGPFFSPTAERKPPQPAAGTAARRLRSWAVLKSCSIRAISLPACTRPRTCRLRSAGPIAPFPAGATTRMTPDNTSEQLRRRDFLTRSAKAGAVAAAAAGLGFWLHDTNGPPANPASANVVLPDFSPTKAGPKLSIVTGADRVKTVTRALQALGGIERFIQRGDRVVLKVNAAFASPAALSATVDPELVARGDRTLSGGGSGFGGGHGQSNQ